MAGISFKLKKMFEGDSLYSKVKGYYFSAIATAGPWISTVITLNVVLFVIRFYNNVSEAERILFIGTVTYTFIFTQIITTPWQYLIIRYIADKLYTREYEYIRPSFGGLNKIVFITSFFVSFIYLFNKPLPISYKFIAIFFFVITALLWISIIYLSALKDYIMITKGFIYGGIVTVIMLLNFYFLPLPFNEMREIQNIFISFIIGQLVTYVVLTYRFLSNFNIFNEYEYDFLRYLNKVPSIFFIGLFYVLAIWVDNIIMWTSDISVSVYNTIYIAPPYDTAAFLAYLTIIPTSVLFLISIEIEFYDAYKKFYELSNTYGTYKEIVYAKKEMSETLFRKLFSTIQIQTIITVALFILSKVIFDYFGINIIVRTIFRYYLFAVFGNSFILIIVLVFLYYEERLKALITTLVFLDLNLILTYLYLGKGINYYGIGFMLSAIFTLLLSLLFIVRFLKNVDYKLFSSQPLFNKEDRGIFVLLANTLNKYSEYKYKKVQYKIRRKKQKYKDIIIN